MRSEVERVIRFQEEVGLDVLVHGEPERNDMVQYFAEQMEGYVFTQNAWVQSYGSRYVRPPIIFGDVSRPHPMTTDWIAFAQSLTEKPVKGMLTGPVTMLQWSFVRDDQPRSETCEQLALAIRDEVADLEAEEIKVIQVDEPAIREGLPLRRDRWDEYLEWAVYCFRVATAVVRDETQIHTHMCYSDFGDIMEQIQQMDADVLLIEAARSRMELLHDWERTGYAQEIGPGVYDIHSPRVPSAEEMAELLEAAAKVLDAGADLGQSRLWPEDPRLARDRGRPAQPGPGGEAAPRRAGSRGRVAPRGAFLPHGAIKPPAPDPLRDAPAPRAPRRGGRRWSRSPARRRSGGGRCDRRRGRRCPIGGCRRTAGGRPSRR